MSSTGPLRPPVNPQVTWSSITQEETVDKGPDGRLTNGYRIFFTTQQNVRGSVFVAKTMYTVANVQAAIAAHARELDQVQQMGG